MAYPREALALSLPIKIWYDTSFIKIYTLFYSFGRKIALENEQKSSPLASRQLQNESDFPPESALGPAGERPTLPVFDFYRLGSGTFLPLLTPPPP